MIPNPSNSPKGYKTTEFWAALVFGLMLAALYILEQIPGEKAAQYYGYVLCAYTVARGLAKFTLPQFIVPTELNGIGAPASRHPYAKVERVASEPSKVVSVEGFVEEFLLPLALPIVRQMCADDGEYEAEEAKSLLRTELHSNNTIPISVVDEELLGLAVEKAALIVKGVFVAKLQ